MKSILLVICLTVIIQLGFSQNNRVDVNQLFISNKLSDKSVKISSSANTLSKFGEIISVDTVFSELYDEEMLEYKFKDIVFIVNSQNKIFSFNTRSANIEISKKGKFSFSPLYSIEEMAKVFPQEIKELKSITKEESGEEYLVAWIPLGIEISGHEGLVELDQKLGLLFNPNTKLLEEVFIWTRP
jgi:hypothetical protein